MLYNVDNSPLYLFYVLDCIPSKMLQLMSVNTKSLEDSCINSQMKHQVQPDDIRLWAETCDSFGAALAWGYDLSVRAHSRMF